jgi:uncharacterized protein YegJ (DUF2314 family)
MKQAFLLTICLLIAACSAVPTQTPTQVPTSTLGSDPEMAAAFQQATDTLDSFIQEIGTNQPNRTLVAVKVRFLLPDGSSQDLWVDQISYRDGLFHGVMGDDIPTLKLSVDDKIKIDRNAIVDWMMVEDGKLVGGYTIQLAFQRMTPAQKQRFLETVNYSIDD